MIKKKKIKECPEGEMPADWDSSNGLRVDEVVREREWFPSALRRRDSLKKMNNVCYFLESIPFYQ